MLKLRSCMSALSLYLIRHARSARTKGGAFGRTIDFDIDYDFVHQCNTSRAMLSDLAFDLIASSPLRRCRSTLVQIFGPACNYVVIDELRAYHSGLLEHQTAASVREQHPDYPTLSFRDRFLNPRFGEESIFEQTVRVKTGLRSLLGKFSGERLCVCTHYSVINILANIAVGNFDHTSYGDGHFDVDEGQHIAVETTVETLWKGVRDEL
jgi:broad specificity phosphatase PhoE